MKNLLVCLALLLVCAAPSPAEAKAPPSAAEAARQVAALLDAGDCLTLQELLPALRDSLPPPLALLSDALTAHHGGRFARSNEAIARLDEYAEELGPETLLGMRSLAIHNFRALDDYAGASRAIRALIGQLPDGAAEARRSLEAFDRWMSALAAWPATTLRRPAAETAIHAELRKVGRGEHLLVEAEANGCTEPFIFDTGCSGSNFLTLRAARRLGVRIVADSVPVTGMTTSYVRIGVADSLRIGELLVLHPTFLVAPSISDNGEEGLAEAVLGSDVIRAMGEVRIEARNGRIVLPAEPSPEPPSPNLGFDGGQYHLYCTHNGERLRLHFDTGNVKSTLSSRYYDRHRRAVRRAGRRTTSTQGGFGGIRELEVRILPHITLCCGARSVTLRDIAVTLRGKEMDAQRGNEDGSLGVDFLTACDAVVIDLGRMFVRTE